MELDEEAEFSGRRLDIDRFVDLARTGIGQDKLGATPDIDLTANGADDREAPSSSAPLRVPPAQLKRDAKLVTLLRNAVAAAQDDSGWARVGTVGQQIGNQASFDPRNYGYPTLGKLIAATKLFDARDEGSSTVAIRDKRHGKAAARGPADRPSEG